MGFSGRGVKEAAVVGTTMMQIRRWAVLGVLLAGPMAWGLGQARAAEDAAVCVAVLEVEVKDAVGNAQDEAAKLDVMLTEMLAKRPEVSIVDRTAMGKVLDERTLAAAAGGKIAAKDVGEALAPFWSAGVLICGQIDGKRNMVIVEGVSAQTGQLLGALYLPAKDLAAPRVAGFVDEVLAAARRMRGQKRVEISGRVGSTMERGQLLLDRAMEQARVHVVRRQELTLLLPRLPLITREERLLRVMGLAKAADAAGAMSAAPEATVQVVVTEKPKVGDAYEATAVELMLRVGAQSKTFAATVATFGRCLDEAMTWLDGQLTVVAGREAAKDDEAEARALAKKAMEALAAWKGADGYQIEGLPEYVRLRMRATALRAGHLDPTNEDAAWIATVLVDGVKSVETFGPKQEMAEYLKFLDQFPKSSWLRRGFVMMRCSNKGCGALMWPPQRKATFEAFLEKPNSETYELARPTFRVMAEWAVECRRRDGVGTGNSYEVCTRSMIRQLIPHIPPEKLDEEHAWWKEFFEKKVDTLPAKALLRNGVDIAAPWELIDAAFAVRRKDVPAVREKLQAAARKVNKSETWVWGGDQYNPYVVPVFLKAAGDPEWQKWDVTFGPVLTTKVTLDEMTLFMSGLSASTPGVWETERMVELKGEDVTVPQAVRKAGERAGYDYSRSAAAMGIVAGDLWLMTPGALPGGGGHSPRFFAVVDGGKGEAQEILWPEEGKLEGDVRYTCHYVTKEAGGWSVWLGTSAHGLARYQKKDGKWSGRWYNSKSGAPSNGASVLTRCRNGGKAELLVVDTQTRRMFREGTLDFLGPQLTVWTLNPDDGKTTLVHDGSKDDKCIVYPAVVLEGGIKVSLAVAGENAYELPLEVKDIKGYEESQMCQYGQGRSPLVTLEGGSRRFWRLYDDAACIQEIDTRTLAVIDGTAPGKAPVESVTTAVSGYVGHVLGTIMPWPGTERGAKAPPWPAGYAVFSMGRGDVIWMVLNTDTSWDGCRQVVGYRPAPKGSKDWKKEDAWIGPFWTPGRQVVMQLEADGDGAMLLSTPTQVLRVEGAKLEAQAREAGQVRSTAAWREEFEKRMGDGNWRARLPWLIVTKEYAKAEALLEKQEKSAKGEQEQTRLTFWRARLLAEQPERCGEAIGIYEKVATGTSVSPAAEAFARANQIVLLHQAGRWAEMIKVAEAVQEKFPQMKSTSKDDAMAWYVADARRKLAEAKGAPTRPPQRPAD